MLFNIYWRMSDTSCDEEKGRSAGRVLPWVFVIYEANYLISPLGGRGLKEAEGNNKTVLSWHSKLKVRQKRVIMPLPLEKYTN